MDNTSYVPIDENRLKFHLREEINHVRQQIAPFLPHRHFVLTKESRLQLAAHLIPHAELTPCKIYYALIPFEKQKQQYSFVFSNEGVSLVYGNPTQLMMKKIIPLYRCQDSGIFFETVAHLYNFKKAPFATRDFCLMPLTSSKLSPKNTVWLNPVILADFYTKNHQAYVSTLLGFDCMIPIKRPALVNCMSKAFILHAQIKKEENYERFTHLDSAAHYLGIAPTPLINCACQKIDCGNRIWPNHFFYPFYDKLRREKEVQLLCEEYEEWYSQKKKKH